MRTMRHLAPAVSLLIGVLIPCAFAQTSTGDVSDWQLQRPEGEEFSILLPKNAGFESEKMPYHKMELSTRLYLSTTPSGPVLAVVSLSGIKSNPAMYTEMERVNSYVDAFKKYFIPKLGKKEAVPKLTLSGNKTLNGNPGRQYALTIADLSGTVQVYTTKKRFYAVVFLNTKKDEELQKRFLSSFELPERIVEPPPTVAAQTPPKQEEPPATTPADAKPASTPPANQPPGQETASEPAAESKPETHPANPTKGPISGGLLNGRAIVLPRPDYPAEARAAHASGTVAVQVVIDEYGNVTSAKAISGHPLLQQASVNAALQAKFSPTTLMGEPVKVTGVLTYNFVL